MLDYEVIAKRLKEARKEMNYSQQEVANFIGKKRSQISYYETGARKINLSLLNKFSNLYGVSVNRLLYGKEQESEAKVFARAFSKLSENDKNEIKNLIDFKKRYKESKNLNV
jgi:transcriptional regulator with XRE-family HTH domain